MFRVLLGGCGILGELSHQLRPGVTMKPDLNEGRYQEKSVERRFER